MPTPDELSPPQNLEAERGVIGGALHDNATIPDAAALARPADFWRSAHEVLWAATLDVYGRAGRVDAILLVEELVRRGQLAEVGGEHAVAEIMLAAPLASNVACWAAIVREKATLRRLAAAADAIRRDCYSGQVTAEAALAEAERRVYAIASEGTSDDARSLGEVLAESLMGIAERRAGRCPSVPTGLRDLDGKLGGGWGNGHLVIVAARPGSGKTSLAMGACENAAVGHGTPTLFFSLEMGRRELGDRVIAARAGVDGSRIKEAWRLTDAELARIEREAAAMSGAPMVVLDRPGRTLLEIVAEARRWRSRMGLGLVAVDYLQLVRSVGTGRDSRPRHEVVSEISGRLKDLARELDAPVLALCQLNREGARERPTIAHLRESGSLEQDADTVILLHRESERDRVVEAIVGKQRHGPTGVVRLAWRGGQTRFADLDRHAEPPGRPAEDDERDWAY